VLFRSCHADHERDVELTAGHVQQRGRVVEDLVEREQAEVHGHDLDDREIGRASCRGRG